MQAVLFPLITIDLYFTVRNQNANLEMDDTIDFNLSSVAERRLPIHDDHSATSQDSTSSCNSLSTLLPSSNSIEPR